MRCVGSLTPRPPLHRDTRNGEGENERDPFFLLLPLSFAPAKERGPGGEAPQ